MEKTWENFVLALIRNDFKVYFFSIILLIIVFKRWERAEEDDEKYNYLGSNLWLIYKIDNASPKLPINQFLKSNLKKNQFIKMHIKLSEIIEQQVNQKISL